MKVMFVVDHVSGGAGNVIQLLAMAFRDHGEKACILFTNGINVASRYDLSGIEVIDFPKEHPEIQGERKFALISAITKGIRAEIIKSKADAVISFIHNNNTICCMAMRNMKIPLVVSERINTLTCPPSGIWKHLRQIAYARADAIIVQCDVFKYFCHNWYLKKTKTIPNPVLQPPVMHTVAAKEKYTVISAGRLDAQKNFPLLIRAVALVHEKHPNVRLRIIGEGDQRAELEKMIASQKLENIVELAGYTTNVYRELANADVYVMTSQDEGFPNALSEAMAVGLPTVSYLCHEGIRDLVQDGVNGILVTKATDQAIAEAICRLIEDEKLRGKIADSAKHVSQEYSVEHVYQMWRTAIDESSSK